MDHSNIKNKIWYWIPKFLTILLGAFFVVFGEFDDSPGLQGIGLILIIATVFVVFRSKKKNK
jgi:drug/metabolite transporter (DMT)-like permease